MLRLVFPVAFAFTKEPFVSMFISSVGLGLYITAFAICRPYKEVVYNKTDIPVLMVLLLGAAELNVSPLLVIYNYTQRGNGYLLLCLQCVLLCHSFTMSSGCYIMQNTSLLTASGANDGHSTHKKLHSYYHTQNDIMM